MSRLKSYISTAFWSGRILTNIYVISIRINSKSLKFSNTQGSAKENVPWAIERHHHYTQLEVSSIFDIQMEKLVRYSIFKWRS